MKKIIPILVFLVICQQALAVSKILPNNPFYFFKKIYFSLKENFTKDVDKKFDFYFENLKNSYQDFYFLLSKAPQDSSKALKELNETLLKIKNFVYFNQIGKNKISELKDFIFEQEKQNIKAKGSILALERELFIFLASKDSFENNFELLKKILNDGLNEENINLVFQLKEILKNQRNIKEWEAEYLSFLKDENTDFLFNNLNHVKISFIFDYWKKYFLEKKINLTKIQKESEILLAKEDQINRELLEGTLYWFYDKLKENKKQKENFRKKIESRSEENFVPETFEIIISLIQEITSPKYSCEFVWEPVCGVDGKTYSNLCFLNLSKVKLAYLGSCITLNDLEKEINSIKDPEEFREDFPEIEEF